MLEKKRRFGEINRRVIRLKWRVILPKGRFGFSVLRHLIFNYLYQLQSGGVLPYENEQQKSESPQRRASVADKRKRNADYGKQSYGHAYVYKEVEENNARNSIAIYPCKFAPLSFCHFHKPDTQSKKQNYR